MFDLPFVGIGALGTAGALGGQLGAATRGGLQTAGQTQQQLLQQAGRSAGTTAGAMSRLGSAGRQAEREATVGQTGILGSRGDIGTIRTCLLYTSPSPRDGLLSRMPSSA